MATAETSGTLTSLLLGSDQDLQSVLRTLRPANRAEGPFLRTPACPRTRVPESGRSRVGPGGRFGEHARLCAPRVIREAWCSIGSPTRAARQVRARPSQCVGARRGKGLLACLEAANVDDPPVGAGQYLPPVVFDRGCAMGSLADAEVHQDSVPAHPNIHERVHVDRRLCRSLPGEHVAARLTRRLRVVGRAPANVRIEKLSELRYVGRFECSSDTLGQRLDGSPAVRPILPSSDSVVCECSGVPDADLSSYATPTGELPRDEGQPPRSGRGSSSPAIDTGPVAGCPSCAGLVIL